MRNSVSIVVTDPETGEDQLVCVYRSRHPNARRPWVIQRLSTQQRPTDETTPPRLVESRLEFSKLSIRARGNRFTGPLPPSAELIQDRFHEVAQSFEQPRQSKRRERSGELWNRITLEDRDRIIAAIGAMERRNPRKTTARRTLRFVRAE